jgi:hypothetical protein
LDGTRAIQAQQLSSQIQNQSPPMTVARRVAGVDSLSGVNDLYQGPKRPDLHAQGAIGRFYHRHGFVFTGQTVGVINRSPSSFYVFGVNRGGAFPPGPFPGRPSIIFDAEIIVATSPDGVSGTIELLNSQGQTTSSTSLASNAVKFFRNHVMVTVGAGLLPATSPSGTARPFEHYSFAFWAGISPSIPKGIASFAPRSSNAGVVAIGFPQS